MLDNNGLVFVGKDNAGEWSNPENWDKHKVPQAEQPEKLTPVTAYRRKMPCSNPECARFDGVMVFTGTILLIGGKHANCNEHKCTVCGRVQHYAVKYPDIVFYDDVEKLVVNHNIHS